MFKVGDAAEGAIANGFDIESPAFQSAFNVVKGLCQHAPTCRTMLSMIAARKAWLTLQTLARTTLLFGSMAWPRSTGCHQECAI
jgi:hypothetical protein